MRMCTPNNKMIIYCSRSASPMRRYLCLPIPNPLLILFMPSNLTNSAAHPATKTKPKRTVTKEGPDVASTTPSKAASTSGFSVEGVGVSSVEGGDVSGTWSSSCGETEEQFIGNSRLVQKEHKLKAQRG